MSYFLFVYVLGMAPTAMFVLRNRMFSKDYLINSFWILLWPVYWGFVLTQLFLNRARSTK